MAAFVLRDALVVINSVDHSDHVRSVSFNVDIDTPESTAMGAVFRTRLMGGLRDANVSIDFNQDFVDNGLDEVLWAMFGTEVPVRIRPSKTDAISASNPEYQFTGTPGRHTPISGAVGDRADTSVNFILTSGTVVRDITP